MSISVVFNGTTYSVPEDEEVGWASLTNYLVDLANAQVAGGPQTANLRVATSTPVTVASTDYAVVTNLTIAGAVAVNLPAGVNEKLYVIVDGKGDAATNNITITPNGAETINGAASLVLNTNNEAVVLIYNSTNTRWNIIGSYRSGTLTRTSTDTGSNRVKNKDLEDSSVGFCDNSDATKKLKFECSGITTGTTRTITVPDADLTVVGTATAQVLTLKDIDGGSATNTSRITVPKGTTATVNALTRKEGTLVYDTDTDTIKYDNGSTLTSLASASVATPTVSGTITTFVPVIASSHLTTTNANYTVLDTDGYDKLYFSTGASTRTLTLPTLADNLGRTLKIVKIDSDVGILTVDGEGAETINGAATFSLYGQYESIELTAQTSGWIINDFGSMPWQSFTPTGAWSTNTTYTGMWRKVSDVLYVLAHVSLAGAPTSAIFTLNLPNSLTINTTKVLNAANTNFGLGISTVLCAGANYLGHVGYSTTTAVRMATYDDAASGVVRQIVTQSVPDTFGASDFITMKFSVPIVTT